ncbi:MAG: hypothetical protein ACI4U3_03540 [Traorella sp.]
MNKNKDIFDTIDEYFFQINSDEISKKISNGVDNISKNISDSIEHSLKNNGYNNFSEFIQGEIQDKKGKQPEFTKYLKDYHSRKEYVLEAIQDVTYEIKYRGYYRDGHQQALQDLKPLVEKYSYNLDELNQQIKKQVKEIKSHSTSKKAYTNGYIDGCEYVQKAISNSQKMMMEKIIQEVIK